MDAILILQAILHLQQQEEICVNCNENSKIQCQATIVCMQCTTWCTLRAMTQSSRCDIWFWLISDSNWFQCFPKYLKWQITFQIHWISWHQWPCRNTWTARREIPYQRQRNNQMEDWGWQCHRTHNEVEKCLVRTSIQDMFAVYSTLEPICGWMITSQLETEHGKPPTLTTSSYIGTSTDSKGQFHGMQAWIQDTYGPLQVPSTTESILLQSMHTMTLNDLLQLTCRQHSPCFQWWAGWGFNSSQCK
jgi:hypothetical protein